MLTSPIQAGLARLRAAAEAAKACEATTGLPAELTMAQWALESGWGMHSPGNNCFGIKTYPNCFGVQTVTTHEVIHGEDKVLALEFATFPNLAACFEKHAELITTGPRYAGAWRTYLASKDVRLLMSQIAPVYATDPDYGGKLRAIATSQRIQQSLGGA